MANKRVKIIGGVCLYKLSIIIPVYNAENCLESAINSIIGQSIGFENIELILVDDNSSDNSKNIIMSYSNKYENVSSFFSDVNHGFPGYGRNVGICNASSEYVMFMDNDDELDLQMCEKLYDAIVKSNADLSCCDILEIDEISEVVHKMGPISKKDNVIAIGEEILNFNSGFVWNKLFKKEIIDAHKIKFLTDNYCDDQAFSIEFMLHSGKLVYLNDYVGYFWNRRNESLSNSKELKNLDPLFIGYDYILNLFLNENKKHLIPVISNPGTLYLLSQSLLLKSKDDQKIFLKKIYDFEEKCEFNVTINNSFFSFVNKLVIKKRFDTAVSMLSLYNKLISSTFLRRMYRKIIMR